ncbi:hypothetical protein ANN_10504 [Periplaneta americana]|uniref:Uncharacterized protein n=1 Tax=Periplaneta americana TaxID=6978 RepID=A0ABQ8TRK6_PERAM|nr:hypothetical protein ANN_10504 [Periplaneta americana]
MGESRNAYRVLVGRPEGKRSLGRPRRRWEDNIKMVLREVGYDDRDWINLAQDRDRWRAYVRAAMNLRVKIKGKGIPVTRHEGTWGGMEVEPHAFRDLGTRMRWCGRHHALTAFYPREGPANLGRIRKEGENIEAGTADSFSSPEKSQPKKKIVAAVDSFDEEVLRRLLYNFYATHKQRPTLQSLLPRMDISS